MTYRNLDFNGTSGTAYGLRYWCNFDATKYWLADRLLVLVQITSQEVESELILYCAPIGWVGYTPDTNKYCIIDLTDIVRTYQGNSISIGWGKIPVPQENEAIIISTTARGIINPAGVLIPERDDEDYCEINAPSVMLAPFGSLQIAFEIWASEENSYYFATGRVREMPGDTVQKFARTVTLAHATNHVEFWHLNELSYREIDIQPLSCERKYACVEWVSFTGQTRRHIFEVSKVEVDSDEIVTLANLANQWTEIKGRVDSFSLRMENLNRYDFWYYSDIITSSRVRVTFDGENWYDVQVSEKKYVLPETNAGRFSKLEIPIKFRRYDAVIM